MNSPKCDVEKCTCPAEWALIPGYASGKGAHLCKRHWQEVRQQSSIQAECYKPLNCGELPAKKERGIASRMGPHRSSRQKLAFRTA